MISATTKTCEGVLSVNCNQCWGNRLSIILNPPPVYGLYSPVLQFPWLLIFKVKQACPLQTQTKQINKNKTSHLSSSSYKSDLTFNRIMN